MAGSDSRGPRALVIGVDHYPHLSARSQLQGCVNDALAVWEFLRARLGAPMERIEVALSTAPGREAPAHRPATAAELRASFQRLAAAAAAGQSGEVIVFYAGHGVRVSRAATGEYVYGFAPADTVASPAGFANLILGRELNRLVRALVASGASPTLIADTCHSGGSVRSLGVGTERRLLPESGDPEWRLGEADWNAFAAAHPALAREPGTRSGLGGAGGGWLGAEAGGRDWVMLAACRDVEVAREHAWRGGPAGVEMRGVLTACLLDELARIPDGALASLRWCDLMPGLRGAVRSLASQRPTLEGREERRVFGGAWEPGRAGFAVTLTAEPGVVELAGGQLHGLEEGAEVAVDGTLACVERAAPSSSVARLASATPVVAGARAVLVRPGRRAVRTRARVPAGAPRPEFARPEPLLSVIEDGPADVEVQAWLRGGWVITPYDAASQEPTPDEVIAYLRDPADPALPARLGAGLAHWARYRAIRDRTNNEPALLEFLEVALRVGATAESSARRAPDSGGMHRVVEDEPLWIEVRVRRVPEHRLFLGVILCSDDGNVHVLWPPPGGDPTAGGRGFDEWMLPEGQTICIGADQHTPAILEIRCDQQASAYTCKVVACTLADDEPPPDLRTLAIRETVQEVVDAAAAGAPKDIVTVDDAPARPAPRWCTWDVPVVVARR